MPFEPLRFLHAAGIRLDHPVAATLPLPPDVAAIVSNSTRTVFQRLIATAVEQRVDFVLLGGNTFVDSDQSLLARLDLLQGLRQLAESEIRVIVWPGPLDPLEAWRQIPDLPPNVTILEHDPQSAGATGRGGKSSRAKTDVVKSMAAVRRDEKVVARIGPWLRVPQQKKSPQRALRSEALRPVAFTVGVSISKEIDDAEDLRTWSQGQDGGQAGLAQTPGNGEPSVDDAALPPVDYLAFGGGRRRRTVVERKGVAHDPGPLQSLGSHEPGPSGCTLVTVEGDGTVRCDFMPMDIVRWERFSLDVPAMTKREELLGQCRARLAEIRSEAGERVSIIEWVLRGDNSILAALADESNGRQFQREINQAAFVPDPEMLVHHFVVHPGSEPIAADADPLLAEFDEALEIGRRDSSSLLNGCLAELRAATEPWSARIESLLPELDLEAAAAHAQRVGRHIFQSAATEGMPG